jgi:nucleoside-diphosphate-sugar epimerase
MKVLLYGEGWIGNKVIEQLEKLNHKVVIGKVRAEDQAGLEKEIKDNVPTHVMSFIGRTHGSIGKDIYTTIDYLEQPGKIKENIRDNLYSPIVLAFLCSKLGIHFTYLGTGCIFEYDSTHPFGQEVNGFMEDSLPNFFGSSYSTVKGYTDRLMHLFNDNVLNLRIRMPITSDFNSRNFITKITTYKKVCSVPNSMTVLDELIPILIDMAEKKVVGTINLTNPGLISHNEILEMYKEIVNHAFKWDNFTIEEQAKVLSAGRSNNYLDTTILEKLYPNVMSIKESVRQCLVNMKNNLSK